MRNRVQFERDENGAVPTRLAWATEANVIRRPPLVPRTHASVGAGLRLGLCTAFAASSTEERRIDHCPQRLVGLGSGGARKSSRSPDASGANGRAFEAAVIEFIDGQAAPELGSASDPRVVVCRHVIFCETNPSGLPR
jgi:hypothetical protein